MSQDFNEQYNTGVKVASNGDFEVAFSGTKDGVSVSTTVTGNLGASEAAPAAVTGARELFESAQQEAAKILEA